MLEKISSDYIIRNVFDYIRDENIKYNILVNSKLFQKKLGLELIDYQRKYLFKLGIHLQKYFNNNYDDCTKDTLIQKLEKDLLKNKIDTKLIQEYTYNYLKKYNTKILEEYINKDKFNIEIYSPFFDIISKDKIFEYIFNILIQLDTIKEYNLTNEYIEIFEKLNKLKINYNSLHFHFSNPENIMLIKELKINYNQIKELTIIHPQRNLTISFFNTLFSLDNILNNLKYLNLSKNIGKTLETEWFENLNNFKVLETLKLFNFGFKSNFDIKLNSLVNLKLSHCNNISFGKNTCLNLKKLHIR